MEDEKDLPPSTRPLKDTSQSPQAPTENTAESTAKSTEHIPVNDWSVPFFEELQAGRAPCSTMSEIPTCYSRDLSRILDEAGYLDQRPANAKPTLPAPYVEGHDSHVITQEQLIEGVQVSIPRCAKIRRGDHLSLHWGCNTFYSLFPESEDRDGPRSTQYICLDRLAKYEIGEVSVSYEVTRGSHLVGVSETLKVDVQGSKKRPKTSKFGPPTRRRKIDL